MKTHTIKTPTAELETLKNTYAQEQGYEGWKFFRIDNISIEKHMYEICIRTQKAALEKAAESTSTQYVRLITLNYQEIKDLITNPENLIR